ncbi:MAG: lamin tail domain-containing protein [Chloroflexus sp.]
MRHYRHNFTIGLGLVIASVGLMLLTASFARAQPDTISCPRNQVLILSGAGAPPFQGLIVLFAGKPVGGGFSNGAGTWHIPLRVDEPPGLYPVEVRIRGSQQLVASYICAVDIAFTGVATASPTATTTTTTPTGSPIPTSTPLPQPSPTSTPLPQPSPTSPSPPRATATNGNRTPLPTALSTATSGTGITATATVITSPTLTATRTTTPTPTATGSGRPRTPTPTTIDLGVTIEILPYDPRTSPSLNSEFVKIYSSAENDLTITGWQVVNISRPDRPTFVFPPYILAPEVEIYLYTGNGTTDPATGNFYWGRSASVWRSGETAHLIDAQGRLVSIYQIP